MKAIDKVPTDVPGLDTLLFGGIPRGRATLVTGRSGTAKSVLALQLSASFAKRGMKTLLLSIEESPTDLMTTAESLDFHLQSDVDRGTLVISDMTHPAEGATVLTGDFDIAGLVRTIEVQVKQHGIEALVLDSATALFTPRPSPDRMRMLFHHLVSAFRRMGLTAVITAEGLEDYGSQLTVLGVEDFVCDLVLILRNHVDGERRRRSIEIHKYRRSRHFKGEYPFTITLRGLVVFPLDAAGASALDDHTRFSSGVDGLDRMTNGGWLRDSIVLVRGPTGSGKTTLSGLYARAGASRGERVIYYGFEETKPMLLRNFASMGMPLEELEKQGNLTITCAYPEATSPEDLLVEVRAGLEQFTPSLIVFDSISSIMHSTSERGFRHFIVGLAALLREHSRSALLTETIVYGTPATDGNATFLSTIPDAILCLDYRLEDDALERSIRILKMRGSAHETGRRRLQTGVGGLVVDSSDRPKSS